MTYKQEILNSQKYHAILDDYVIKITKHVPPKKFDNVPVYKYEGLYTVNKLGEVFSLRNKIYLKKVKHKDGYFFVHLSYPQKTKVKSVHKIVVESFLGPVPKGLCINHINGIKTDNRLENLEVVTYKQNIEHAWKTGLSKPKYGVGSGATISFDKIKKIRKDYEKGMSQADLVRKYKSSKGNMHSIIYKKTRKYA